MLFDINRDGRQEGLEGGLGGCKVEAKACKGCRSDLSLGVRTEPGGCVSLRGRKQCGPGKERRTTGGLGQKTQVMERREMEKNSLGRGKERGTFRNHKDSQRVSR